MSLEVTPKKEKSKVKLQVTQQDLPIIKANAQELEAHEAYLDDIEKNKPSLWRSISSESQDS